MGRRKRTKWIPAYKYDRMPHAASSPFSLWWYRADSLRSQREKVIDAYIEQASRGRSLPKGFKDDLIAWIEDILTPTAVVGLPGFKYWTLPAFALANGVHPKTFCKRFREMEKIAKRLFPEIGGRLPQKADLTEADKREIQNRYITLLSEPIGKNFPRTDYYANMDCVLRTPSNNGVRAKFWYDDDGAKKWRRLAISKICKEFRIDPFRVGQVCAPVRNVRRFPREPRRFPRLSGDIEAQIRDIEREKGCVCPRC